MLANPEYIETVVNSFYEKAINDFLIGYHFRKIRNDQASHPLNSTLEEFAHHIPRIVLFWKMQLIKERPQDGSISFDLINTHHKLSIRQGELNRWVMLFMETLEEQGDHPLKQEWKERILQFQSIFLMKLF